MHNVLCNTQDTDPKKFATGMRLVGHSKGGALKYSIPLLTYPSVCINLSPPLSPGSLLTSIHLYQREKKAQLELDPGWHLVSKMREPIRNCFLQVFYLGISFVREFTFVILDVSEIWFHSGKSAFICAQPHWCCGTIQLYDLELLLQDLLMLNPPFM